MSAVDALVERLRATPLAGPRDKLSAEVREWAEAVSQAGSDAEILAAFNHAADVDAAMLRADLTRLAEDADERRALVGVLSRPGTTDAARLAVLAALNTTLTENDVEELARVSVRQRAAVLGPTLDLLASMPTAEALFALAKVFVAREDELGERAAALANALRRDVPAAAAIDAAGEGEPDIDSDVGLAFAAAASDPVALARLRGDNMTPLKLRLAEAVMLLDERLQTRTKEAGGSASDFDVRLRGELYQVIALTALPADEHQQARALENIFRRTDLVSVAALAPALPAEVLRQYVTRSLTRVNRRGARADRALFALGLVADDTSDLWGAARSAVLECLDEDSIELRVAASKVLARRAEDLDPKLRRRLATMFASFDRPLQEQVVDDFAPVLATEAHEVDLETFIRWVATASVEELGTRLGELFARMVPGETSPDDAQRIVTAFLHARAGLSPETRASIDRQATEALARWIHGQGGRTAEAARAVLSEADAANVVVADLSRAIAILRADQARPVVAHLIESLGPRGQALVAVASADIEPAQFERVVLPALASAIASDPQAVSAVVGAVNPAAGRRLLTSAVSALGAARRRMAELSASAGDENVAALTSRLGQVLAAVDVAERAAVGNDELLRHFGAIRQAVSGLGDTGTDSVPETVREWRLDAAIRSPDIVGAAAEGCQPLHLVGDLVNHAADVIRLLAELDQRAHSPRVVTADARSHHVRDLESCVYDVADAGLLDDPHPLSIPTSRTSLAQAAWSAWARRHEANATERLREATVATTDQAVEPRLVLRIDALAPLLSDADVDAALSALPAQQIEIAWRRVRPALVSRTRELAGLEEQARSRSTAAMERIAGGVAPSLRAIESVMASYFRLRRLLADAGWKQVEDTLGRVKSSAALEPADHQVVGSIEADEYLVRTLGIRVKSHVVDKAIVEAIKEDKGQT